METIELRPARALLTLRLIGALFPALIPGVAVAAISAGRHFNVVAGFVITFVPIAILLLVYTAAHFRTIHYEIDDRRVTNSSGVFWKVRRSTPLDKITNVDVRHGPLDRRMGIGQIWIYTPSTGSLMPEAMLVGVKNPHEIKSMIINRSEAAKSHEGPPAAKQVDSTTEEMMSLLRQIAASLKEIQSALGRRSTGEDGN